MRPRGIATACLTLLALAPYPALAALPACPAQGAPVIAITTDIADPRFDFSMAKDALNKKFANIPLPNPQIYHSTINSVMTGPLTADHVAGLHETTMPQTGQTCLALEKITVTLHMQPVIYMATQLRTDDCRYKAFFEHEMKHVAIDRDIMKAYTPKLQNGLKFAFGMPGDAMIGPVPASLSADARKAFEDRVSGAIQNLFRLLMQARLERQHSIDGPGEYARLSNACDMFGLGK